MLKRVIAVAAVFAGAFAAPAAAQQYPPAQNALELSDACVPAGTEVTVTARTFTAGAPVAVALDGAPVATATADGNGVATLVFPAPEGTDGTIEVSATGDGATGPVTVGGRLTVDAEDCAPAATPPPADDAGAAGGDLPRTGSDVWPLVRAGLALAALGGLLLAVTRRRRAIGRRVA